METCTHGKRIQCGAAFYKTAGIVGPCVALLTEGLKGLS